MVLSSQASYDHAEPTSATWWLAFAKTNTQALLPDTPFTKMLKFNTQMRPSSTHVQIHIGIQICTYTYTQLAIDIPLNAKLNVPNYLPSPEDAISSFNNTSFYQTTQDNGPSGAISLTHQEPF